MEMLTVRAWKSTSVKAGDGQNHSYCRPQVVPPATAFFCHTSQGHLRIVLAGVVWPGCLWPSSDCPHLQKSFRDWLVPISLSTSPGTGEKAVLTHRPQETETAPTPALPSLAFAEHLGFKLPRENLSCGHTFDCAPLSPPSRANCPPVTHLPTLPQAIPLPFPAISPSLQPPFICKT